MKKLVTCNGAFDGLHPGHLFYLGFCRGQGDELVVGINGDDYIRNKKQREPIPETIRAAALMELGFISKVIIFREPNPCDLIRFVKPQVHCTGAEYQNGKCAEEGTCKELGIELVYVPRVGDWSSTNLRRFFKNLKGDADEKPLTPREMDLFIKALYWRNRQDSAFPDIGAGVFLETLARDIAREQGIPERELLECVEQVRKMNVTER